MSPPAVPAAPPRIAHVTPVYPPYGGGTGRVAFEYTERLRRRGFEVNVFFPAPPGGVEGVLPHVRPLRPLFRAGLASFIPGLPFLLKGYDIVHLHYPFFGGAVPAALARGPRLVMTYHMDPLAPGLKGILFKAYTLLVLPLLVHRAERILVSSLDYAGTSPLWRIRRAREKTEEHPLGVDLSRFRPRETLPSPGGERTVLFVGSLDMAHYFKGLDILLGALGGVKDPPWRLHVVGAGELEGHYRQAVEKNGMEDRVSFLGKVSDQELPRLYREAFLHCMPSTGRSEAFGLVALEAAASGVPTVASNLPGVRTVVEEGRTGLLVPPGDVSALRNALAELLSRPEQAERMGRAARERAERLFSWEKAAGRLAALYREVMAGRPRPSGPVSSPPLS